MCYNSNGLFFQLVTMDNYAKQYWEVLFEVNLNQKTLKIYTSWVHWKNQCRLAIKNMLCHGTRMDFNILLIYFSKITLTHFMALISFYTPWNTSENQRFLDVFRGHRTRPVPWNGLRLAEKYKKYKWNWNMKSFFYETLHFLARKFWVS